MEVSVFDISVDDNEADTSEDEFETDNQENQDAGAENGHIYKASGSALNSRPMVSYFGDITLPNEFTAWERPKVPFDRMFYLSSSLEPQPDAFKFFILDSVSTISAVKHPGIRLDPAIAMNNLPLNNVIRLFGVTTTPKGRSSSINQTHAADSDTEKIDLDFEFDDEDDLTQHETKETVSVCCNVHGFSSYFYILPIALHFDVESSWFSSKTIDRFKACLDAKIKESILTDIMCTEYHEFVEKHPCIGNITPVKAADIDGIYQYFDSKQGSGSKPFLLKICCTLPRFIWTANTILNSVIYEEKWKFQCFETNINNNIRFLTDRNIYGCSWYQLSPGKYFVRNSTEHPRKETHCQIEIDVSLEDIAKLEENHQRYKLKPAIRVLSFDIEVMVSPNDQNPPMDGKRQILQISSIVGNYYSGADSKSSVVGKTVFVLGSCDPIEGVKVVQFYIGENPSSTDERYLEDAEAKMLSAWRNFLVQMDPDVITGYNIKKFDFPYLIDRANVLWKYKPAQLLPFLGRIANIKSKIRLIQNPNKKIHQFDEKHINIQGRLILDFYPLLCRHDLRKGNGCFKLSNVAKRFLGKKEEKHSVSYADIEGLQHGGSACRNRMARYCVQDAVIPLLLLFEPVPCRPEIITFLDLYFMKSQKGGTLLRYLFTKSMSYNEYFKQVRLQKNPRRSTYVPDTPSPKKPWKANPSLASTSASSRPGPGSSKPCSKNLFPSSSTDQDSQEL